MDIIVPAVGESIIKGVLVAWIKKNGETVKEQEPLFELETEKATVEVPSPFSGILQTQIPEGADVVIGQTVGTIVPGNAGTVQTSPLPNVNRQPLSPSVRRLVDEKGLEKSALIGTGKGGRITKADVLSVQPLQKQDEPTTQEPPPLLATNANTPTSPPQPAPISKPSQTRIPMSPLRKRTAERLVRARIEAVHVTTFNEVDMSNIMKIRSHFMESFEKEHGIKIGYSSFFVKTCCIALKMFPQLNAYIDNGDIVFNNVFNIGMAVSIDKGLLVPVIKNADALTFAQIENEVATKARLARDKKLLPDELSGGTFTITNGGVFGSLMSTPVPAYPQSAILGLHAIKKRPVVIDDQIVIRPMMYVALTYDHRIVDGKEAIEFLVTIKEFIEDPDKLLLEM